MSRIKAIKDFGQQIWLDFFSRELVSSGELARMVKDDGIAGVTSNPAIFFNAINTDAQYQAELAQLKTRIADPEQRFEALALPDIQAACDVLRPLTDSAVSLVFTAQAVDGNNKVTAVQLGDIWRGVKTAKMSYLPEFGDGQSGLSRPQTELTPS